MIGKRLNTIIQFCGKSKRIADIGCDHGYVLSAMAKNGAKYLVASDISAPSVKKAETLLNSIGFDNFSVRVGDGLATLNDEDSLDMIVIAGMGGYEIMDILSSSHIKLTNLVLQPQNNVVKLRKYLMDNNFYIVKDIVVEDRDKFYNVLKVKKVDSIKKLTKRQLEYGKTNLSTFNADFINMLNQENQKLNNRLQNINNLDLRKEIEQKISNNNFEIECANNRR